MPPSWPGSTWERVCETCFGGDEAKMLAHAREYLASDPNSLPVHLHLGTKFRDIVGARQRQQWWTTALEALAARTAQGGLPPNIEHMAVFFYDTEGLRLGSMPYTALPLYKGMQVSIHGHHKRFKVVRWELHHGHPDEEAGLRVVLEAAGEWSYYPPKAPVPTEP